MHVERQFLVLQQVRKSRPHSRQQYCLMVQRRGLKNFKMNNSQPLISCAAQASRAGRCSHSLYSLRPPCMHVDAGVSCESALKSCCVLGVKPLWAKQGADLFWVDTL